MLKIAYTTGEYIKVPLTQWEPSILDPTTLPVELAATDSSASAPGEDDWVAGSWVTEYDAVRRTNVVKARALWSGLVAVPAARTTYVVWMRVTATPEVPVLHCGTVQTY